MKNQNVIEITETDKKQSTLINSLQSVLKRIGGTMGFGISPDGKRNYSTIFGYGETLTYQELFSMFYRHPIGNAVVSKVTRACWGELPKVLINDEEESILDDEIKELNTIGLFRALERADILNRIGKFSCLLIGVPDGLELDKPLGKANSFDGMYFNPYNEDGIVILEWDNDPLSPRFGLPEKYQLRTTNNGDKTHLQRADTFIVHHSRIVHLAEGALDSSIEGSSAITPVWNALVDLTKINGGSAEAYFRNARQQRSIEATKDARIEQDSASLQALKDNLEAFTNGWDDTLRLQNMTAKHMQVNMISPRDAFDVNIETVAGQTGIPIRILTGKGGGQLAGVEDRASWNALISDRRKSECTGYLTQAFNIFQNAGLIEIPKTAIIQWAKQSPLSEKELADLGDKKADTFNKIIDAMNKPIGDEADLKTVLKEVGLREIEIDLAELPDAVDPEPKKEVIDPDAVE